MAREIKTRLALEGEQQFKSAMREAANSIKVLNSAQKLAKAQFKQTGDSEKYVAQQSQLLKQKIEEQKKAVKAAEDALKQLASNGVKENDRAMQQWQTRLNDARTSLTNMETELQNLESSSESAASATDQLGDSLGHLDKTATLEALGNAANKIADGIGAALGKVKELAQGLITELTTAASWADELLTTATMWEMDPEQLQRMRKTAKLIDTDVETILSAQQRFMRNVTSDSKEADEAFQSLGIHVEKYKYGVWSFDDMVDPFWQAGEALMTYSNAAEREAIATKLFGKSWHELIPLFKAGREEYEKTMAEQSVVSEENVNKLGELDDAVQKLENEFETFRMTIDSALAPTITELSDKLSGFLKELNAYLASDEGKQALKDLGDAFHSLFEDLGEIKPEEVFEKMRGALDKIREALQWIKTNRSTVVGAIEAIVGAWAALKVTAGMTTLLQLINGLRHLTGSDMTKLTRLMGGGAGSASAEAGAHVGSSAASSFGGGVASTLSTVLPNLGAGALFMGGSMLAGYLNDEAYTAHVNEVAQGVDEITASAANAKGEVAALSDQLETLKKIYLEEAGADAFKDLDTNLIGKVAPDSMLMQKVGAYGGVDQWLQSGEAVGAQAWAMAEELINAITDAMSRAGEAAQESSAQVPEGTAAGIEENTDTATSAADALQAAVAGAVEGASLYAAGQEAGAQLGEGMAVGMESKSGRVQSAAGRLASLAAAAVRTTAQIHSPSKLFADLGKYIPLGFAEGIESQLGVVGAAAEHMVGAAALTPAFGGMPQMGMAGAGAGGGSGMVDVTLMIGPEKLSEVLVPIVNEDMGAQLMRR